MKDASNGNIFVGCSGWQYRHWRGNFYPAGLPVARWFEYYAEHFDTVEINNTFYRLAEDATFKRWRARASSGFVYAIKASRFLTHMKKLNDPEEPLSRLFHRLRALGSTLGPVLYQLPPHFAPDLDRLEVFLRALPRRHRHVLEVRDPRWYTDAVVARLIHYGVALCVHDMEGSATGPVNVGPLTYVRFHGPQRYSGAYADDVLERWAEWCAERAKDGPVFAYFNNDIGGHAPRDAQRLRRMIRGQPPPRATDRGHDEL